MSPDSPETRIRQLEAKVTALETHQQDHERDIRQYAPSLIEQARMQEKLNSMVAELRVVGAGQTDMRAEFRRDVDNFNHEIEGLQKAFAHDRLEREKIRADREEKERERDKSDRRWRVATALTIGALAVSTLGLLITVLTLA